MTENEKDLFEAAQSGNINECKRLVALGTNLNAPNSVSPLMIAAANGQLACVEYLAQKSDIAALDQNKMNAIMHASSCTSKSKAVCHEMLRQLFARLSPAQHKECCGQQSTSNETALYFAIRRECEKCVSILAPYSDVRHKLPDIEMTLMVMANGSSPEIFQILESEEERRRAINEAEQFAADVPMPHTVGNQGKSGRL